MKKFKLITILTLFISVLFLFVGCSKESANKEVDFKTFAQSLKSQIDVSSMKEGDADKLKRFYGIEASEYEDFMLFLPPSNIKADELLILKAKSKDNVNLLKEKVEKRINEQSMSFKDYLPNEYALIQKNVVEVKGQYILLSISKDADKVQKAFKDGLK